MATTKKMTTMEGLKFGFKAIKWIAIVFVIMVFVLLLVRVIVMSLIPPTI